MKPFCSPRALLASVLLVAAVVPATAREAEAATIPSTWPTVCGSQIANAGTALSPGVTICRWITVDGLTRRYVVFVPAEAATTSVPVVFMFHGSGGTGEKMWSTTRWKELAATEGFIAVFPTGRTYKLSDGKTQTKWHDFSLACDVLPRPASWPATSSYPADDEGFVDAILGDLDASTHVDHDRVYASGFSNGSAFAQRLSVSRADTFAAVGSWAGQLRECVDGAGAVVEPIVAPHAQVPAATPVPIAIGLGNIDPKSLDAINAHLTSIGEPPITEIPLDQASVERYLGPVLLRQVRGQGLAVESGTPIGVTDWAGVAWLPSWKPPVYSTLQWTEPAPGNEAATGSFTFMLLDGVTHRYPNANAAVSSTIRPSGSVNAAWLFWAFFERHVGT